MSVDVSVGHAILERPTGDYAFDVWVDSTGGVPNVVITTAPASNSRIDAIVAWVDTSVTTTASNNSPGALKFSAIAGTVAGSPSAPVNATIQTALGSTVAWTRLANVAVGTSVPNIVNANIADARTAITTRVNAANVVDGAITNAKLSTTTGELGGAWTTYTPTWSGGSPSIGDGTLSGRYTKIGKTISFVMNWTAGSATTYGSGVWSFSLPLAANGSVPLKTGIGTWYGEDAGTQAYFGTVLYATTTTLQLLYHNKDAHGTPNSVAPTAPFTWGSADYIHLSGTYEAA